MANLLDEIKEKITNSWIMSPFRAYENLSNGQTLKEDLEQGKITGKSEHHADNYAHTHANIINGQDGLDTAISSLAIGTLKETYDITKKTIRGDNLKKVLKDSYKDMKNNLRGIIIGLKNPTADANEMLVSLNLDTNQFEEGHNNQIANFLKAQRKIAEAQIRTNTFLLKDTKETSATIEPTTPKTNSPKTSTPTAQFYTQQTTR